MKSFPHRLFWPLLALYFFCSAGHIDTIDAEPSMTTAKALVERGSFVPEVDNPIGTVYFATPATEQGPGLWITKMGVFFPVLYTPAVILAKFGTSVTSISERRFTDFFISFYNSFITALIVVSLYYFLKRKKFPDGTAVLFALFCGLGTLLFPYAKTSQREPLQALALLVCYGFLSSWQKKEIFWAGIAGGLAFLAKPASAFALIPSLLFFLPLRSRLRLAGYFFFPLSLAFASQVLFNWYFTGHYFSFGYSVDVVKWGGNAWKTPFLTGILLQLFSVDRGLLFWNPLLLLLLAPLLASIKKRQWGVQELALMLAIASQVILHAKWWSPTGDWSLGPRYLVGVLPLFFLWLKPQWVTYPEKQIKLFFFCAVLFQIPHVVVKSQQFHEMRRRAQSELVTPFWIANGKILIHKLKTNSEIYGAEDFGGRKGEKISLEDVKSLQGFNFWWSHLLRNFKGLGSTPQVPLTSLGD